MDPTDWATNARFVTALFLKLLALDFKLYGLTLHVFQGAVSCFGKHVGENRR